MRKLHRRDVLENIGAGALALPFLGGGAAAQAAERPNILFILADDMGYADVGCYGRPDIKTPAIDGIAAAGTRFLQAYANSAVCSATRTALITGRYQDRLRIGLEEPLAGNPNVGLPPSHPTLPSLLKKVGYSTTLIGKWHLGAAPKFGPLLSGYDHFYGFRGGALDYFRHTDPAGHPDFWDDNVPISRHGYLTNLLGDRAVETVRTAARGSAPFLLSLHFNAPHWPWEGPGDEAESARLDGTNLWDFDGGNQRIYEAMITDLDYQVGRVLQALEETGLASNTIVIFTSDNGGERFADVWPFTGMKTELLEGGLRIPAIIRWPGRIPAGRIFHQVAISMDWLPTLLAAAGTTPDPAYPSDGVDLLPLLTRGGPEISRSLFWRYKANAQRAARVGDYKYLKIIDNGFLFDVVDDPQERANLKQRHRDIYERLVADWFAWNAAMLPEVAESYTDAFTGRELANHIGAQPVGMQPDNPGSVPSPDD